MRERSIMMFHHHLGKSRQHFLNEDWSNVVIQLEAAIGIILAASMSGPDSDRENVTGLSTVGKNRNHGNSGFTGGCTLAAA